MSESRVQEIKHEIIGNLQSAFSQLTSVSNSAVYRAIAYAVAKYGDAIESLFETQQTEIQTMIDTKAHTLTWYANAARQFRLGQPLDGFGNYVDTGLYDEEITALQCCKDAVVLEQDGSVLIKVRGANRLPLSDSDAERLQAYMMLIKDAGVPMQICNAKPDAIRMTIICYINLASAPSYNDLLLQVRSRVTDLVANMPFGGTLYTSDVIASVVSIVGIRSAAVHNLQGRRDASLYWLSFQDAYTPYAGYSKFDTETDLAIELR